VLTWIATEWGLLETATRLLSFILSAFYVDLCMVLKITHLLLYMAMAGVSKPGTPLSALTAVCICSSVLPTVSPVHASPVR
jgi:hypothetical protein